MKPLIHLVRFAEKVFFGIITFLTAVLLSGCTTTGLSQREVGGSTYARFIQALHQNQPGDTKAHELLPPIRIGVGQIGEAAPPASVLKRFQSEPALISKVVALPIAGEKVPSYPSWRQREEIAAKDGHLDEQVAAVRHLAKELGVDYVVLLGGNIDTAEIRNAAAWLDITVLGMFVIPSYEIIGEGKAAAALIDAETGKARMLSNAQLKRTTTVPSIFGNEYRTKLQLKLRDDLVENVATEFLQDLKRMQ